MKRAGFLLVLLVGSAHAAEFLVSPAGNDTNPGTEASPFRTIQHAADVAQPGDVITVHAGTYREWVKPPRGGTSDTQRITYRAAAGEKAIIKGSEAITGWVKVQPGVWKAEIPDAFFKDYNPFIELMKGDWFQDNKRVHHTGEVFIDGVALREATTLDAVLHTDSKWYCANQNGVTQIWANFRDQDPNKELTEVTARKACFYPEQTGRNFITVQGFTLAQAASPWAPPTTDQMGLIGTNWSKGWIIENNTISDAKCSGITLGKDSASNAAQGGATPGAYNTVIANAAKEGWSKDTVGSHIVRDNTICNCGQAGICGSLGAVFSQVVHNHIYNIHRNESFGGLEIAAIKFHAAIDVVIRDNCIHDADRGLWLDWMAQGTRVTGNIFYQNGQDAFCEVDHGPFLFDHNLLMSEDSFFNRSEGGAYAHNLFFGKITGNEDIKRSTPYFEPHSTTLAGSKNVVGGDDRFLNNLIWSADMKTLYKKSPSKNPVTFQGNIYGPGAQPYARESDPVVLPAATPPPQLVNENGTLYLKMTLPDSSPRPKTALVTTEMLGKTMTSQAAFENADGSPLTLDHDYAGKARSSENPDAGPFEAPGTGELKLKIWSPLEN